jgi:hypothetical protein
LNDPTYEDGAAEELEEYTEMDIVDDLIANEEKQIRISKH